MKKSKRKIKHIISATRIEGEPLVGKILYEDSFSNIVSFTKKKKLRVRVEFSIKIKKPDKRYKDGFRIVTKTFLSKKYGVREYKRRKKQWTLEGLRKHIQKKLRGKGKKFTTKIVDGSLKITYPED